MIQQEYKIITVHTDNYGDELCLRIEDSDSISGIMNLCWLNERETEKLIQELQEARKRMTERRTRINELIRTTNFTELYNKFEEKYNPYPVQMSRAEAFGNALADGLIDEDTYHAAYKYYKKLWFYVGD